MADAPDERARTADGAIGASRPAGPVAPDVRVGGRRVMLAPHNCFACGQLNIHGLRIELHAEDGRCWTELALAPRFEGWEGIAHGGILCTLLDEVMAWALIEHDSWAVTARMVVEFKQPVEIGRPIRAEGWIARARRRILETEGRIVDAATGKVLATASGTYVAASEERKRELKEKYRFDLRPEGRDHVTREQTIGRNLPRSLSAGGHRESRSTSVNRR